MKTLYLVRHGAVLPAGAERICLGRRDLPLSDLGRAQAAELAPFFSEHPVAELWSSPLTRCRETAILLGAGREVHVHSGLIEVDVGKLDCLPFSEIRRRFPEAWEQNGADPFRFRPPGGEPFEIASERFSQTLRSILQRADGDVAVVTHAGVGRLFLCRVQGWAAPMMYRIPQPYGCVNTLTWLGGDEYILEKLAEMCSSSKHTSKRETSFGD